MRTMRFGATQMIVDRPSHACEWEPWRKRNPLPQAADVQRFLEVQVINKQETLWIKIPLHDLERDLDGRTKASWHLRH